MNLATQFWRVCDLSLIPIQGSPGDAILLWAGSQISPRTVPEGWRAQFLGHFGFLLHSCAWTSHPWPGAAPGEAASGIWLLSLFTTGVSSSTLASTSQKPLCGRKRLGRASPGLRTQEHCASTERVHHCALRSWAGQPVARRPSAWFLCGPSSPVLSVRPSSLDFSFHTFPFHASLHTPLSAAERGVMEICEFMFKSVSALTGRLS